MIRLVNVHVLLIIQMFSKLYRKSLGIFLGAIHQSDCCFCLRWFVGWNLIVYPAGRPQVKK